MSAPIHRAYIQSNRSEIVRQISSVLRQIGIQDEMIFRELPAKKLISDMEENSENAILILDWELGSREIVKVMRSLHELGGCQARPTLLIAAELSNAIIAAGAEYGIWQVHTGEVSTASIRVMLQDIVEEAKQNTPIRSLLTQVESSRAEGDWDRATQILEALREQDESNPRVAVELAENYFHTDQWGRAQKILDPLVKERPEDARALNLLGRCYAKLGRYGEATKILEQAKILNPYNLDRLLELGQAFLEIDKVNDARKAFDEAEELDPESKDAKKGRAQCMLMDGEVNEGLTLIRNSASKRELASIFNTSAVLTMRRNQHEQAMKLYDAAIKAIGEDRMLLSRLFFNKGVGNWKFKMLAEAQQCFRKAVDLDPTNNNAAHNLKVFEKSGNSKELLAETPDAIADEAFEVKKTGTDDFISIASPNLDIKTDKIFDSLDDEDEHF